MELKPITPEDQNEIYRFIQDLEFVQSLSSPLYLHFLAKSNYFDDEAFLNYLKYLSYFNNFEYKKYITYTRSLIYLDLLQYQFFRENLKKGEFINFLRDANYFDWVEEM